MNQTPAALLILAASVLGYGAQMAANGVNSQSPVILTLAAIAVGVWGVLALITASVREGETLASSHSRLDVLDRALVREPVEAIKNLARPAPRRDVRRPLEISSELQTRLNAVADLQGRDRNELLEETLRRHLPKLDSNRSAA